MSQYCGCAPFNCYYFIRRDDDKASILSACRFQTKNNMLCQLVSLKHPRLLNHQKLSHLEGKSTGGHVDQCFSGVLECLTIAHWQGMASNNVHSKNELIIKLSSLLSMILVRFCCYLVFWCVVSSYFNICKFISTEH